MPEKIGRLERLRRIGVGGFATVWLYNDPELDSPVALKALADNWAQRDDVRERFLTEARILRKAENEHIVRVYDIGEVDEVPYFVMTYADRGSVAELFQPGVPLDPDTTATLLSQAGRGLDALHRHGIIHRDIKPNNLLLRAEPDGSSRLLVADLGVAKEMLHASGLTQVVGTPAFMAPEQAAGIGIDLRADVHGLGAVAYTLLTGRYVREGGVEDLLSAGTPKPPSAHTPGLSADVDAVVLRAVHPDPERRWPTALAFTDALAAAVNAMRDPDDQDTAVRKAIAAGTSVPSANASTPQSPAPRPGSPTPPEPDWAEPDWDRDDLVLTEPIKVIDDDRTPTQRIAPVASGRAPAAAEPEAPAAPANGPWPTILLALIVLALTFGVGYFVVIWFF